MSSSIDPLSLTLAGLAHRCTQETQRFFQRQAYDPAFCYELFRRAILDNDQHAHALIYHQYEPLVIGWVERHPGFATSGEDAAYFANRAFEKLWRALTPAKFHQFKDLKALLGYLKLCTHSAVIDFSRVHHPLLIDDEPDAERLAANQGEDSVQGAALDRAGREDFWQLIDQRLADERERTVIYASFVLGMKPAELLARYDHLFGDVREVYRTKQNVLERLRRDRELARWME